MLQRLIYSGRLCGVNRIKLLRYRLGITGAYIMRDRLGVELTTGFLEISGETLSSLEHGVWN
ncbi:MAG: hypothetical protein H0W34_03375 [Pyrinomonadaceae bacterium]|nr:hypothetical protein [Pyrinomonadaceae bacterium]MBA3732097.1 hypothetical protein [Gammaproteobacteria bacterium]